MKSLITEQILSGMHHQARAPEIVDDAFKLLPLHACLLN